MITVAEKWEQMYFKIVSWEMLIVTRRVVKLASNYAEIASA